MVLPLSICRQCQDKTLEAAQNPAFSGLGVFFFRHTSHFKLIDNTYSLLTWTFEDLSTEWCVQCWILMILLIWWKTRFFCSSQQIFFQFGSYSHFIFILISTQKCYTQPWIQGQQNVSRHSMMGSPPAIQACATSLWLNLSATGLER